MVDETEELQVVHYRDILNIRNPRYRCTADLKIVRRAEAVKFIDEVGVALLFPGDNMALPTCGRLSTATNALYPSTITTRRWAKLGTGKTRYRPAKRPGMAS